MLFIGSCGAGLCNLLGPLADNYALILLLRALNGYFMAMVWPPMNHVFGQMLLPRDRVRYTIHMSHGQPSEEETAQPDQPVAAGSLSFWRMMLIPGVLIALGPVVLHGMIVACRPGCRPARGWLCRLRHPGRDDPHRGPRYRQLHLGRRGHHRPLGGVPCLRRCGAM